jgi:hypothetical protein
LAVGRQRPLAAQGAAISGTRRSSLVREFADRAASLYLLFITYLGPTGGGLTVVERNAEYDECEHQRRLQ